MAHRVCGDADRHAVVDRRRARRAAAAVRALVPGPERGALLPHHGPRRTGSDLRRGSPRRRRHPSGSGGRTVSGHRHAARLGRQQDQLRVDLARRRLQQHLLRPPGIRGPQLHRARLRRLLRRSAAARPFRSRAARATSISPTPATRRATPSTCSACSPTRAWSSRRRSASPASPTEGGRAWSSPSCAIRSAGETASSRPGEALTERPSGSPPRSRAGPGPTSSTP